MSKDDKIVAVGLLTGPELKRWGRKLRHVCVADHTDAFDDLLKAIDAAEAKMTSHKVKPD